MSNDRADKFLMFKNNNNIQSSKTSFETHLCTKFVVPSTGSTIHVGTSVISNDPERAVVSSPINC